jgi:hypothetical protein
MVLFLLLLLIAVLGGVMLKALKPEYGVTREVGRAMMWAGIFGLVLIVIVHQVAPAVAPSLR